LPSELAHKNSYRSTLVTCTDRRGEAGLAYPAAEMIYNVIGYFDDSDSVEYYDHEAAYQIMLLGLATWGIS